MFSWCIGYYSTECTNGAQRPGWLRMRRMVYTCAFAHVQCHFFAGRCPYIFLQRYVELQFLTYDDDRQNTSASRPELLQILPYELYRLQPEPFDKVTPFIQVNMSTLQSRYRIYSTSKIVQKYHKKITKVYKKCEYWIECNRHYDTRKKKFNH